MKNLKTLTAIAAVMLAGLAAPMATASHPGEENCPASYTTLGSSTVNRDDLSGDDVDFYRVTIGSTAEGLFLWTRDPAPEAPAALTFRILKEVHAASGGNPAKCVVETLGASDTDEDTDAEASLAASTTFYIEVMRNPLIAPDQSDYSIKVA